MIRTYARHVPNININIIANPQNELSQQWHHCFSHYRLYKQMLWHNVIIATYQRSRDPIQRIHRDIHR